MVRVLVVAIVALLVTPAPVAAQARLLSSTPDDGQSLQRLEEIEFEFDSLLLPDGAEITVTKLDGTRFPVETAVDGAVLRAVVINALPSGNYEVSYRVLSADGAENTGSVRVGIDAPEQALSGGLLAVLGIFGALLLYLAVVFRADKRRRPGSRAARHAVVDDGEMGR